MGVNQLWTILEPVRQRKSLKHLSSLKLAVDLSIWIVESQRCSSTTHIHKPHLRNLFFRVSFLCKMGVSLVFVLDGEAPELKIQTIATRLGNTSDFRAQKYVKRQNFQRIVSECVELLESLGIPCLRSKGEAESLCALLNANDIVDGCITDDGDAFLYGAKCVYRNFNMNSKDLCVDKYSMEDIVVKLNLNRDKLIGLALLTGCDYFPKGIPGIGMQTAVGFLKQLKSENVLDRISKWKIESNTPLPFSEKPPHCSKCGHLGSMRKHATHGCVVCNVKRSCLTSNESIICPCDWHSQTEEKYEYIVFKKIQQTNDFPAQKVSDEYGITKESLPQVDLRWTQPSVSKFQEVALKKMKWTESYCLEKLLPLLTRWTLIHSFKNQKSPITPNRIITQRKHKGEIVFEVEWYTPESIGLPTAVITTLEPVHLFRSAFPEHCATFDTEVNAKKAVPNIKKQPVKTKRGKENTQPSTIKDFFTSTKTLNQTVPDISRGNIIRQLTKCNDAANDIDITTSVNLTNTDESDPPPLAVRLQNRKKALTATISGSRLPDLQSSLEISVIIISDDEEPFNQVKPHVNAGTECCSVAELQVKALASNMKELNFK